MTDPPSRSGAHQVLLAVYARHGGDLDAEPVREMVSDHARIRTLVMGLQGEIGSGGVDRETLREIGERLEAHIRLEERRVFPMMEASLSEWRSPYPKRPCTRSGPGSAPASPLVSANRRKRPLLDGAGGAAGQARFRTAAWWRMWSSMKVEMA